MFCATPFAPGVLYTPRPRPAHNSTTSQVNLNVASAFFMHSSKTCHQRHPTTSAVFRFRIIFGAFLVDVIHPEVSGWLANGMAPLIASWPLSISQLEKSCWKCRLMLAHLLVTRHATHNTWSIPPSNPQSKFAFDSLQARSGYCSQFLQAMNLILPVTSVGSKQIREQIRAYSITWQFNVYWLSPK